MSKKVISKQFSLKWRDAVRGLIIAVLTPAIVIIQQSLQAGVFVFDLKTIGMAAVGGGLAYLAKNFLEPTKTIERV
jgi:hypothetical protein